MKWWNRFFFSEIDPTPLAFFRIAFGIVAFICLLGRFHDRLFLYSQDALISPHTVDHIFRGGGLSVVNRWLYFYGVVPSHDPALMWFFIALMIIAIFVTIGLCTRVSTVLLFIGLVA